MGYDAETQQFQELTDEEAKTWKKGPIFHIGEEITLKGVVFLVADVAPGQIKLKPKKT
jgi:hypothetical protein